MKTAAFLTFAAGAATASVCFLLWNLLQDPEKSPTYKLLNTGLSEENQKLNDRVKALEKQVASVKTKAGGPEAGAAEKPVDGKPQVVTTHQFDESKMEEMMKQHMEREVNRETDAMALRLKLTPEQKGALRKFLLAKQDSESLVSRTTNKNGETVEEYADEGQSEEDFLEELLTPEQLAEYARSLEEQHKANAEDYAQRKLRKLNEQLSLSEQQKDSLFQAFAQKKLAGTDPAATSPGGDVLKEATGGAISIAGAAIGSSAAGPIGFEFDVDEMFNPGSGELDRATLEGILTPEQLAVYDERQAEEKERGHGFIHIDNLSAPREGAVGAAVHIEVEQKIAPPASSSEK
jgi:hypothetical protein